MTDQGIEIKQVRERNRFEIAVDGEPAGVATYRDDSGRRTFIHTEIDPSREGQGLGGRLIRAALDATRAEQLSVVPECHFVAAFIERHPDYADLVAA